MYRYPRHSPPTSVGRNFSNPQDPTWAYANIIVDAMRRINATLLIPKPPSRYFRKSLFP